jgi:Domain of unknown function (DUF4430)
MRAGVVALLATALVAGCGLGAGSSREGGATVTVTRDFGTRDVGSATEDTLPGNETVMRQLARGFDVQTRYGGGFVQAINGIAGGRRNGRPVDWFYYVNGIEAPQGATARKLAPGDDVWWDQHDWSATMRIPAVVGAFPEPFLTGSEGRRLPVRLGCAAAADAACDEVERRLDAEGVTVAGRSAPGGIGGVAVLRVQVGRWADLRREPATRELEKGPAASGVYARPDASGDAIALLDARGRTVRTLRAGAGLVAATALRDEAPTWIVTGTDDVGLAAAAAQLQTKALRDRFAIAVEDGRPTPLPLLPPPETP